MGWKMAWRVPTTGLKLILPTPPTPQIYHIVHIDRLRSILDEGGLLSDAEITRRADADPNRNWGTTIGMSDIKRRRRKGCRLSSHPGLFVGRCVPFYFCPRSVMLYVIHKANHPELAYRGGQVPIVHLEADLRRVVAWAEKDQRRWAFTLSNAGSGYFRDFADLAQLDKIDWGAIAADSWQDCKEEKQAEFLVERSFPWNLVTRIGVISKDISRQVSTVMADMDHRPSVEIKRAWYY